MANETGLKESSMDALNEIMQGIDRLFDACDKGEGIALSRAELWVVIELVGGQLKIHQDLVGEQVDFAEEYLIHRG